MTRVHLDAALPERRADIVLGRERIRARRNDVSPRRTQREREASSLGLEVHDHGNPATMQCTVAQPGRKTLKDGHVLLRPSNPPLTVSRIHERNLTPPRPTWRARYTNT